MKILVVCQHYYPENFVVYKIAESLVSFGHSVTVLTGKPNYGYDHILPEYKKVKVQTINGVTVHRVKIYPRKESKFARSMNYLSFYRNSKKWVRRCKEKFDVVYSMSISPVLILAAGNLYKKRFHVPHIVHCVDLWPESVLATDAINEKSVLYRVLYKWSRKLYSKADTILLGSPSFKRYFIDVLHISDIDMKFVPQPSLVQSVEVEPFIFDNNYFNILYCGNLGLLQNIELIPEAMKLIKNEKIKFHIIGMGPMQGKLKSLIEKYDLKDNLIYYGPKSAAMSAPYFLGCDALYVSLKNKGYIGSTIPNKLVMSLAFSKPIIGVVSGDGANVLNEANGSLFAEENPLSISHAFKAAAHLEKDKLIQMGKNNKVYFDKNFDLTKICRGIEAILANYLRK